MFKRLKEYLTNNKKNSVGRPKLASKAMIKAASIEAVLALVLCATIVFSGAGVLTGKTGLELLGINNKNEYKGSVTRIETYYGVQVAACEFSSCIDNYHSMLKEKGYSNHFFLVETTNGVSYTKVIVRGKDTKYKTIAEATKLKQSLIADGFSSGSFVKSYKETVVVTTTTKKPTTTKTITTKVTKTTTKKTTTKKISILNELPIISSISITPNGNGVSSQFHNVVVKINYKNSSDVKNINIIKYLWRNNSNKPVAISFDTNIKKFNDNNGATLRSPSSPNGNYYLWLYIEDKSGNAIITGSKPYVIYSSINDKKIIGAFDLINKNAIEKAVTLGINLGVSLSHPEYYYFNQYRYYYSYKEGKQIINVNSPNYGLETELNKYKIKIIDASIEEYVLQYACLQAEMIDRKGKLYKGCVDKDKDENDIEFFKNAIKFPTSLWKKMVDEKIAFKVIKRLNPSEKKAAKVSNRTNFLRFIEVYLENVKNNSTFTGFWIIDDFPFLLSDIGEEDLLEKINEKVHRITGYKSICGYGAGGVMPRDTTGDWIKGNIDASGFKVKNFSTKGCDMIGIYMYGKYSLKSGKRHSYEEAYSPDWTMPKLLPAILKHLKDNSLGSIPIVGVPQAFGSEDDPETAYLHYKTPNYKNILDQTKAYMSNGAKGVIYFSFNSPINPVKCDEKSLQLYKGVAHGINSIRLYGYKKWDEIFETNCSIK